MIRSPIELSAGQLNIDTKNVLKARQVSNPCQNVKENLFMPKRTVLPAGGWETNSVSGSVGQ